VRDALFNAVMDDTPHAPGEASLGNPEAASPSISRRNKIRWLTGLLQSSSQGVEKF
jgi:hypothetical protein